MCFEFVFSKMFRIQKILLAEYQELYEPVLLESPFAEVTEHGIGLKQVQLGLTPTRIIIGQDVFDGNTSCYWTNTAFVEKDPEIECFQLINVLPLAALKIFFFKKGQRAIMNIRILDEKMVLYEFGGHLSQNLFWNTWRERVATLRLRGANLFNISHSSPFSSSDVIPDNEEVTVSIYPSPRSYHSSDNASYHRTATNEFNKRFSSICTDAIDRASSINLPSDTHHQMELQNYFRSLSVTNTFSCGCNTSW